MSWSNFRLVIWRLSQHDRITPWRVISTTFDTSSAGALHGSFLALRDYAEIVERTMDDVPLFDWTELRDEQRGLRTAARVSGQDDERL